MLRNDVFHGHLHFTVAGMIWAKVSFVFMIPDTLPWAKGVIRLRQTLGTVPRTCCLACWSGAQESAVLTVGADVAELRTMLGDA